MAPVSLLQVVDRLAGEEGMEGVREEVPGLLGQILGGELVMLEGLPDERIRCRHGCVIGYLHEQPASTDKLTWLAYTIEVTATGLRIVFNVFVRHTSRARNSLTKLFQAVGLKSRKAGEGGEAGYGIPDEGCEDSEAVMKKVTRGDARGQMQVRSPCESTAAFVFVSTK